MIEAYLALGSNIGDKINYIKSAYIMLEYSPHISIIKKSSFYSSAPYGQDDLNDFINTVIKIETDFTPRELLSYCKKIEKILGRQKTKQNQYENRPIDIDILFYGKMNIAEKDLIIPHKDLINRDFVLFPLKEISEHFILPNKQNVEDVCKKLKNTTQIVGGGSFCLSKNCI